MKQENEDKSYFDSPDKFLGEVQDTPEEVITLNKREFGRWSIHESQIYLEVLKRSSGKDLIRELKKAIPSRVESQIRAHHQKMLRKYGTIQKILLISDRKDNRRLIQLNMRVKGCLQRLVSVMGMLQKSEGEGQQVITKVESK